MKMINVLFVSIMLVLFAIACEKSSDPEKPQNNNCIISNYLDSTYFSFTFDNEDYSYVTVVGGIGATIESYLNTDSVIIGFSANGNDLLGESIYLDFYYKISEKELKESDTTTDIDLYKVSNFDTLNKIGEIGLRRDFLDPKSMVGAKISFYDRNGDFNTTNVNKNYEEMYNVTIPVTDMHLANTFFIIEQRVDLCEGHFIINGKFETDIYNLSENKFYKLSNGKFLILMYHNL